MWRTRGLRRHVRRRTQGVPPAVGIRPGVPRLQRHRVGCDQQRFAVAVGSLGPGPGAEARPVPRLRRRPVSGRGRRRGAVGDRRLHVHLALPVRAANRQRAAEQPDRAVDQLELHPQQRESRGRRVHRRRDVLRRRPGRPHPADVAVGVPRPVHPALRHARRSGGAPPVSRGSVPRADRVVLQVPGRARGLLPAHRCLVGGAGAVGRPPGRRHTGEHHGRPARSADRIRE